MSLEQAILEHASALREVAAAIRERNAPINAVVAQISEAVEEVKNFATEPAEQVKTEEVKPDAELETAVQQVEQAAQEESAPLDYKADVRPVLLALNKAKGADALKGLLGKYGAATGDKLDAEHYAAIVADAKALIG